MNVHNYECAKKGVILISARISEGETNGEYALASFADRTKTESLCKMLLCAGMLGILLVIFTLYSAFSGVAYMPAAAITGSVRFNGTF